MATHMDAGEKQVAKQAAARAAVALVAPGMTVGLGSGSTASLFIEALAERIRAEGWTIRGVPTSAASAELAARHGLPVVPLGQDARPDLTVDGADEVGPNLALIKGGGGALVREKLVAASSRTFVVIADAEKMVAALGAFPLPVALFPFGWETTRDRLQRAFAVPVARREDAAGAPVTTDDGLYLADLRFGQIADPDVLERDLKRIVGVAETGLFLDLAARVLVGHSDGRVDEHHASRASLSR